MVLDRRYAFSKAQWNEKYFEYAIYEKIFYSARAADLNTSNIPIS